MMRMLMMGPQGVGKGTQAKLLAAKLRIPHISTGDVFRDNIARETPLGVKIKDIIHTGGLVPDELTDRIVADRLVDPDCANGWILDGYPRTVDQVRALDALMESHGHALDVAVALLADPDVLIARINERIAAEGRADDNPEAIRTRLETYAAKTAPLLDIYRQRGLLVEVPSQDRIEDTQSLIVATLAKAGLDVS